jgi:Tfp pilus assembly protein PilF
MAGNSPAQSKPGSSWTASPAGNPGLASSAEAGNALNPDRLVNDLLAMGTRSREAGDLRGARSAFEQALRLSPNNVYANYQLAMVDDDQGRFAEAENHYLAVLRQSPNSPNPDVLASMGWSYQLQGRYDDSERVLQDALRYDPKHQTALYNLGWLYGNRGEYDRALATFRRAGSEVQAQQALAELRQTAGGRDLATQQAYAAGAQNTPSGQAANQGSVPFDPSAAQIDPSNPQAKKFIEDFQKKLAEQNRQKELWNKNHAARGVAAPDPWKNGRGATAAAGQRSGPTNDPRATTGSRFDQGDMNALYTDNSAAFSGSGPTQANQPRLAIPGEPQVRGTQAVGTGMADARSATAQNLVYEQPAARHQYGQQPSRGQYPVITPGSSGGAINSTTSGSWNSLPADGANPAGDDSRNVSADYQSQAWSPVATGRPTGFGQPAGTGPVVNAAGTPPAASGGVRNAWQDAQTTAAQLGLNAGPGGLGLPLSDWSASAAQQLQNATPANPGRSGLSTSNSANWPQGSAAGTELRQPQPGTQPNGQIPPGGNQLPPGGNQSLPGGAAAPSATPAGLPAWPGRPLGAAAAQAPVVPSAQAMVYGSNEQSQLPNFYSGRTTIPRQQ